MSVALIHGNQDAPVIAGGTAPLRNLTLLSGLITRSLERAPGLPGMVCFSGWSGYGKSYAAAYAAGRHRAYHLQASSGWTRKFMLREILGQMGIVADKTIPEMSKQIGHQLALSGLPLIIDEFDHVVARGLVEVVRDIYEYSQGTIALIGEERLPQKLQVYERFHGRILHWVQAQPCGVEDAKALAALHCPRVDVLPDLLADLVDKTDGSTRRVCVNLTEIGQYARSAGLARIGAADWAGRPLNTGAPPSAREIDGSPPRPGSSLRHRRV